MAAGCWLHIPRQWVRVIPIVPRVPCPSPSLKPGSNTPSIKYKPFLGWRGYVVFVQYWCSLVLATSCIPLGPTETGAAFADMRCDDRCMCGRRPQWAKYNQQPSGIRLINSRIQTSMLFISGDGTLRIGKYVYISLFVVVPHCRAWSSPSSPLPRH